MDDPALHERSQNMYYQTKRNHMRQGLRTGIVTTNLWVHGGVSTHTLLVYNFLKRWGMTPEIISTSSRPPVLDEKARKATQVEFLTQFDGAVHELPYVRVPFAWTVMPALYAAHKLRQYDMLICVCGSAHVAFSLACLRLPYVVWMGTLWEDELRSQIASGDMHAARLLNQPLYPLLAWQERLSLRRAQLILTNSRHTTTRVTQVFPHVAAKVRTAFLPVDTAYFQPNEHVRASPRYGNYLLLTARLNDPRKNVVLLLQAFARVRERFPHLRLVLTGESPGEILRREITALGLEDAVVFTGYVSRDELRELYQGALLYVLSSNQEGLGLVLLEAMACGTPVISTRCGGPEDIIEDGLVGRLVPPNDVSQLASAIIGTLEHPMKLGAMREQCVTYVRKCYSLEALENQFYTAMREVFPGAMQA